MLILIIKFKDSKECVSRQTVLKNALKQSLQCDIFASCSKELMSYSKWKLHIDAN